MAGERHWDWKASGIARVDYLCGYRVHTPLLHHRTAPTARDKQSRQHANPTGPRNKERADPALPIAASTGAPNSASGAGLGGGGDDRHDAVARRAGADRLPLPPVPPRLSRALSPGRGGGGRRGEAKAGAGAGRRRRAHLAGASGAGLGRDGDRRGLPGVIVVPSARAFSAQRLRPAQCRHWSRARTGTRLVFFSRYSQGHRGRIRSSGDGRHHLRQPPGRAAV